MQLDPRHLSIVTDVISAALNHQPVEIYVVGSFARGEERLASDLDIMVRAPWRLTALERGHIREALEESSLPYTVDLIDAAAVAPTRRKSIWRDAHKIFPAGSRPLPAAVAPDCSSEIAPE